MFHAPDPSSLVNLSTTTITTAAITNKILLVYCQLPLLLLLLVIIMISLASQRSAESLLSQAVQDHASKLTNSSEMVSSLAKIFSLPSPQALASAQNRNVM